jgi:hypothetical protein
MRTHLKSISRTTHEAMVAMRQGTPAETVGPEGGA